MRELWSIPKANTVNEERKEYRLVAKPSNHSLAQRGVGLNGARVSNQAWA